MPHLFRYLGTVAFLWAWFALPATGGDTFTGIAEFASGATIPIAWGDYDGNGNLDLAVGNYFSQANELYVGQGNGSFVRQAQFGVSSTFAVAWAHYNNDGRPDLAVGNNGRNALYVNKGAGRFTVLSPFESARSIALAWGDYDLDGDLDLAVGNGILGVVQQNRLYVQNADGLALTLLEMTVGDLNCDGEISAFDIEPFLVALFEPGKYAARHPDCEIAAGDINADGAVDAFDIEPFLDLLFP